MNHPPTQFPYPPNADHIQHDTYSSTHPPTHLPHIQAAGCVIGVDYPFPIVDHAVVSKENMGKMKAAYDAGKLAKEGGGGGGGGKRPAPGGPGAGGGAKKTKG